MSSSRESAADPLIFSLVEIGELGRTKGAGLTRRINVRHRAQDDSRSPHICSPRAAWIPLKCIIDVCGDRVARRYAMIHEKRFRATPRAFRQTIDTSTMPLGIKDRMRIPLANIDVSMRDSADGG